MNKEKILKVLKNTAVIIVIISLFTIIYYQNRDRAIGKILSGENQKSKEEQSIMDGLVDAGICKIGEKIGIITTHSYSVIDENAKTTDSEIALSEPVIYSDSDYAVFYSADSKEATVSKNERVHYTINAENRIIKAKVNRNGYGIIVTEKEGYTSEIVVYNRLGEAIFRWDLSSSELIDADLNSDNNKLILSVLESNEKKMCTKVMLIDITSAKVENSEYFDNEAIYKVEFNRNSTCYGLGSSKLFYFNSDGTVKWEKSYKGKTLLKADLTNPDMVVLAYSGAGSGIKGNSTELEVVSRLGKVTASKTIDGLVEDISVNKAKIAVAIGKNVEIYTQALKLKETLMSKSVIEKIEFFENDNYLFVLGNTGGDILKVK